MGNSKNERKKSMILYRIRAALKSILKRESFAYRVSRACFQKLNKIKAKYLPPPPPREITHNSIFTEKDELPMCSLFPKEILDLALETFLPRSILDVGCGTGLSLDYFLRKNIDAWGVEGSTLAAMNARNPKRIVIADLQKPVELHREFDLIWCFEVAEHIHPDYADELVSTLTKHGNRILLSAAPPGQGGCGHLNEQLPAYWIEKITQRGFKFDKSTSETFWSLDDQFASNILIFQAPKDFHP